MRTNYVNYPVLPTKPLQHTCPQDVAAAFSIVDFQSYDKPACLLKRIDVKNVITLAIITFSQKILHILTFLAVLFIMLHLQFGTVYQTTLLLT